MAEHFLYVAYDIINVKSIHIHILRETDDDDTHQLGDSTNNEKYQCQSARGKCEENFLICAVFLFVCFFKLVDCILSVLKDPVPP